MENNLFCPNCGARTENQARFCRGCGASLARNGETRLSDTSHGWPGPAAATVLVDAPATTQTIPLTTVTPTTVGPGRATGRPRWLLPAIVAAAAVLVGCLIGALVLRSGDSGPSFSERANTILAAVVAADRGLDARVRAVQPASRLSDLATATTDARQQVVHAQGALTMLDAAGDDEQAKALLAQALEANLSYLDKLSFAANRLTSPRAAAAASAGERAAQAYGSLSAWSPDLTVPTRGDFISVTQLPALAAQQETAARNAAERKAQAQREKAATTHAIRTYVESIDRLLANSAETRSNLGTLIGDIESGQLSAAQASAQIASIINQRQDLQNQAAVVATPPSFTVAADKLRQSIAAAIEDDYAIQAWINAWYDLDPYAYDRAYAEHEQATTKATNSKADFLTTYNDLRNKHLKLAPIDVNY
jgi:hypothetical protein